MFFCLDDVSVAYQIPVYRTVGVVQLVYHENDVAKRPSKFSRARTKNGTKCMRERFLLHLERLPLRRCDSKLASDISFTQCLMRSWRSILNVTCGLTISTVRAYSCSVSSSCSSAISRASSLDSSIFPWLMPLFAILIVLSLSRAG
jgi:hypothetical protein